MTEIRQEWLQKDYYRTLGVSPDASPTDVTKAYRALARQLHPDRNPDDGTAEERFKEVSAAYDVVGDADKRKQYDEIRRLAAGGGPFSATGPGGSHSFQFSGADGLGDLLANLFGGHGAHGDPFGPAGGAQRPQRGADLQAQLTLPFAEALDGTTTAVTLGDRRRSEQIKVRIPPGVIDGQRIRLRGKGGPGTAGGPPGDLYVIVRVGEHPLFGRDGDNLTLTVPVSFSEAALGARLEVPTYDGDPVRVRLPAGTQSGRTLRVRGRGVQVDGRTGDLLITVEVVVPKKLNAAQRRALEDLAEAGDGHTLRQHLGVSP